MAGRQPATGARRVAVGDRAPEFTLPRQGGGEFRMAELLGSRPVVLYFYPRDDTGGCTAEACGFRDRYEAFTGAGAEVVGVSRDSVESHERFASKYNLPFPLCSDRDGTVHRLYGVPRALGGLLPGRVTYIIDREGVVRHIFDTMVPSRHVGAALDAMNAAPPA